MSKSMILSALVLAGVMAWPAQAQTPTSGMTDTTTIGDRNDDTNWSWIGLLGLAGLMGLRRSSRDTGDHNRARAST